MKPLFLRVLALLLGSFLLVLLVSFVLFKWISHELEPGEFLLSKRTYHNAEHLVKGFVDGNIEQVREKQRIKFGARSWILDQSDNSLAPPQIPAEIRAQIDHYPKVILPYQNSAGRFFIFAHKIKHHGETYRVVITSNRPPFANNGRIKLVILPIVVMVLGLLIASAFLSYWILRPLRSFRRTAQAITADNISARIDNKITNRKDAFGELGREFIGMTSRVEQSVENQRQLLRDVSHELRSPLARIQVAASLSAQKFGEHGELERIEHEVERLDSLIESLLSLSRLQNLATVDKKNIDLALLLQKIIDDANFEFQSENKTAVLDTSLQSNYSGNQDLLASAFENIIRNGLRFSPATGILEISIFKLKDLVIIEFTDQGPGLNPQHLERIFDAFFQADQARTHSSSQHGIGLALAKAIVTLHGGEIIAENRPSGGLLVRVSLMV